MSYVRCWAVEQGLLRLVCVLAGLGISVGGLCYCSPEPRVQLVPHLPELVQFLMGLLADPNFKVSLTAVQILGTRASHVHLSPVLTSAAAQTPAPFRSTCANTCPYPPTLAHTRTNVSPDSRPCTTSTYAETFTHTLTCIHTITTLRLPQGTA